MLISRLQQKTRLVVLGLSSGTSADGLDLAVMRINRSGRRYRVAQIASGARRYPEPLRAAVLHAADAASLPPDVLIRLDQALGQFFGRSAAALVRRLQRRGIKVDAIASHGQTVRHVPRPTRFVGFDVRGTLQLGSLEQIAARTGKIVVGDFRQADVALGNEGAPITTSAMQRLFATPRESRLIANIGGMANYFYFPAPPSPLSAAAADCGPGNSLCDILSARLFAQPCDRGGKLAAAGQVSKRLLSLLLAEPFFRGTTLSTGREVFGQGLAEQIVGHARRLRLSKHDVLATVSTLTTVSIANCVRHFVRRDRTLDRLYLTGGGVHNRFFVRHLGALLDGLEVVTVASLGYDPDLVEAAAFAVMGEAALRGEALPTGFAGRGGSRWQPVLGKIVQPPQEG